MKNIFWFLIIKQQPQFTCPLFPHTEIICGLFHIERHSTLECSFNFILTQIFQFRHLKHFILPVLFCATNYFNDCIPTKCKLSFEFHILLLLNNALLGYTYKVIFYSMLLKLCIFLHFKSLIKFEVSMKCLSI